MSEELANKFHSIIAKLLFVSQHGRTDIQTAVGYSSTQVSHSDEDNNKKLTWLIKYLQAHPELELTLQADSPIQTTWWVNAAYPVNDGMKNQTGGVMSLGLSAVYATSKKQKLVTQSSTEAELVGLHNVLPQVMWVHHFLHAQGYPSGTTTIYHDNNSAMLLAENGHMLAGKR